MRQIKIAKDTGIRTVFLPGNHDWHSSHPDGLEWVQRQGKLIEQELGEGSFLPKPGCLGLGEVVINGLVQVLILDSEWFLRGGSKFSSPEDGCSVWNEDMAAEEVRRLFSAHGESMVKIFLQHHPLESVGTHAHAETCTQNFGCARYRQMREGMLRVLESSKPLICAAGHDHSLQVLQGGRGCEYFLVSGGASNVTAVTPDSRTLFAQQRLGFMRLDVFNEKKVRLRVIGANSRKKGGDVLFETWLRGQAGQ